MTDSKVFYQNSSGQAVGGSEAACCQERYQIQFSTYMQPVAALNSTFLQSNNSLDITFNIQPNSGVHLVDNMMLEMQLTNTTGATAMNLVRSPLFFQYVNTLCNNTIISTNWMQPDSSLRVISEAPEIQAAFNNSIGVNNTTYVDDLVIPPTTTVYTRVPFRSPIIEQRLPLWLPNLNFSVTFRVLGGPALINDLYSQITNLQCNGANVKLLLQGVQMTDAARAAYTAKLMGADRNGSMEKIYRFTETQQYIFGLPTVTSGQPVQVNFSSVGNMVAGFPMISPNQPIGAQLSYGTVPILSIDLVNGGQPVSSSLGNYADYTSYILLENSKYVKNVLPMTQNNLYFIPYSRDPLTDIFCGSSHGQIYTNGINLSWQIVPGSTPGVPVTLYFWGYFKSLLTIDYNKGLFRVERWTAA